MESNSDVYKVCPLYSDISYATKNMGSLARGGGRRSHYIFVSLFLVPFLVLRLALPFRKVRQILFPSNSEVPELSQDSEGTPGERKRV